MPHKPLISVQVAPIGRADLLQAGFGAIRGALAPRIASTGPAISATQLKAVLDAAREDERRRLAHELHDDLGAHLTAFRYVMARLEPWLALDDPQCAALLDSTQRAFDALCDANRRIVAELHTSTSDTGLLAALSQWSNQFQTFTRLPMSLVCAADPRLTQLRPAAATALLRIAQEAANNAAKHAGSPRIDLRISAGRHYLQLCVTDYGRGFAATARPRPGHFGIDSMRSRCQALGGTLKISSQAGSTRVTARLPWLAVLRDAEPGGEPA